MRQSRGCSGRTQPRHAPSLTRGGGSPQPSCGAARRGASPTGPGCRHPTCRGVPRPVLMQPRCRRRVLRRPPRSLGQAAWGCWRWALLTTPALFHGCPALVFALRWSRSPPSSSGCVGQLLPGALCWLWGHGGDGSGGGLRTEACGGPRGAQCGPGCVPARGLALVPLLLVASQRKGGLDLGTPSAGCRAGGCGSGFGGLGRCGSCTNWRGSHRGKPGVRHGEVWGAAPSNVGCRAGKHGVLLLPWGGEGQRWPRAPGAVPCPLPSPRHESCSCLPERAGPGGCCNYGAL